ncbi:MAG: T9SS type A sorting domain-containing protein [Paludibacteraceae bacterium]|nr:T9SS type A sorting domain-containing protein [Paludibacteraceae bacterium]
MAQATDALYKDYFFKTNQKCNDYVIILIGGTDEGTYPHFFKAEAYKSYQYFLNVKGCDKSKIKVVCHNGGALDLDNDGSNDVYGSSNKTNIDNIFNDFKTKMTSNDKLNIVAFAHGGGDYLQLCNFGFTPTYLKSKLALLNYKTANLFLYGCHSGSWIDDLKNPKHTIITCTGRDHYGRMDAMGDRFSTPFLLALSGKMKVKVDENDWAKTITPSNPITANADYNKDGVVSIEEAFVYAKDNAKESKPTFNYKEDIEFMTPRYWSSETPWRFCREHDWGIRTVGYVNSNKEEEAMYLITANGTLGASADVTLSSGKTIRFEKGFKTQKGAHLLAQLFDCEAEKRQNPDELRKKYLTEEEEIAEEVTEESVASIEVAPNPSNGIFIVTLGEAETDITLMDIQGRVLKSYNRVSGNFEIDITDAPNGMYLMVLASDSFKVTRKIVKY